MELLIALGAGAVAFAAVYAILTDFENREGMRRRLRESIDPERPESGDVLGGTHPISLLERCSSLLGGWIRRRLPIDWLSFIRRRILSAGITTTLEHFTGSWALLIGSWHLFLTVLRLTVHLPWYAYSGGAGLALVLPFLHLAALEGERRRRLHKAMPFLVDFVAMCVEAGLSLEAAFARASQRMRGPLQEELRRYIQNVNRSATRREALNFFAEDVGIPEARDFVAVVIQSETFGLPLASVLKAQARQLREERRMQLEEVAQKIPVKLLIPLVIFILPTLFFLVLGPAAIWTIRTLTQQ